MERSLGEGNDDFRRRNEPGRLAGSAGSGLLSGVFKDPEYRFLDLITQLDRNLLERNLDLVTDGPLPDLADVPAGE